MDTNTAHEASCPSPPSSPASSSSSSIEDVFYDVFLSFSGEDTRKTFTDHLYWTLKAARVDTFIEEKESTSIGETISDKVKQAIQGSRVAVIIFSRSYADSIWCLEELVKIMECKRTMRLMVLPIFYDVDPLDVKYQSGTFAEAFQKHEDRFHQVKDKEEKLRPWRNALTEAADLPGEDFAKTDGYQGVFITKIVDEITRKLKSTSLGVATGQDGIHSHVQAGIDSHLQEISYYTDVQVGLDSRVQEICNYLHGGGGSNDVRMIGICGMGGIGKTTVAKAIFDKYHHGFDGKSFLQVTRGKKLVELREQLVNDILDGTNMIKVSSVAQGTEEIKKRLRSLRVLVIIDDLVYVKELNELDIKPDWFGPGSRIIITTRDKNLLGAIRVDVTRDIQPMTDEEALQLFSWHAFRNHCPNEGYLELSREVVHYCGGLPLALEVLGSHLCRKSTAEWKSTLGKLKIQPDWDVCGRVKISYDGLTHDLKEIFICICSFFIGKNKDYVLKMLNGHHFDVAKGIEKLHELCLVTVDKEGNLMMHDMIQDMGREIVLAASSGNREKRRRLWIPEDAKGFLRTNSVSEEVDHVLRWCSSLRKLTRQPSLRIITLEQSSLQLVFAKSLSLPIFTASKISDEDNNPIKIFVVDKSSGANQMVPINLPNPIKVEIVVLDGDFPIGDRANWTSEEFDNNVLRERTGKRPLLTGDVNVMARDGFATVGEIEFTDNSSWIRSRKFRLGARVAPGTGYQGARIREAMTNAFVVKDNRGELYKKHHPPMLEDEVWRLEKIGKDGAFHNKLASENIHTVQDFLRLFVVEPSKLRRILGVGMSEKMWEVTIKHARTCVMGNKMYIFRGSHFLIFLNPICQVLRAVVDGQNFPTRDLSNINRTYIENLVREAYVNWNSLEVVDAVLNETALLTQEQSSLQLVFAKSLSLPIFTASKISDEDNNPIKILVVDKSSGANHMVPINLPNPIKVEIVVLDGEFPTGDRANWTSEEFDNNVLKERTGKRPLLTGDVNVTARDGFATVGEIEFTDNSSWIRSRKFRLGARVAPGTGYQGARIREAMTDAFVVKDHRGELYKKHYPPMLEDEVWRLEKIGKDGAFHKKLASENIHTVQDFLKLFVVDCSKLRRILGVGMSEKMWEVTIKHARTCVMGNKMYIFRGSHFLIFLNPICQVLRAVVNGQNFPTRDLSNINRTYIENLVREAYVNWNSLEVVDAMLNETALLTQGDHLVEQYPNHHPHAMVRAFDQQNERLGAADHHHHISIDVGHQASSIDFECTTATTGTSENTWQINTPPYLLSPLLESIKCSIPDSSSDGDLTSQGL